MYDKSLKLNNFEYFAEYVTTKNLTFFDDNCCWIFLNSTFHEWLSPFFKESKKLQKLPRWFRWLQWVSFCNFFGEMIFPSMIFKKADFSETFHSTPPLFSCSFCKNTNLTFSPFNCSIFCSILNIRNSYILFKILSDCIVQIISLHNI